MVSTESGLNALELRFMDDGVRGICEKSFCNSCSSILVFKPKKQTTMTCLTSAQCIPPSNSPFDSFLFIFFFAATLSSLLLVAAAAQIASQDADRLVIKFAHHKETKRIRRALLFSEPASIPGGHTLGERIYWCGS